MTRICNSCGEPFTPTNVKKKYKCNDCINVANKEKYKEDDTAWRNKQYKYRYGITLDEFNTMLVNQGGACAICGATEPGRGRKNLLVDHCHDSKKVRALLCYACNTLLGAARDNPTILQEAIAYLETHHDLQLRSEA